MDQKKILDTFQEEIRHVFQDELEYVVPKFQREYSWEEEHISEFMLDLISQMDENPDDQYFFGTILLYPDDDRWAIIDGQQRLATSVIFLCVVRDMIIGSGNNTIDIDDIRRCIKLKSHTVTKFRLKLSPRDNSLFEHTILTERPVSEKLGLLNIDDNKDRKLAIAYKSIYNILSMEIKELSAKNDYLLKIATYFIKNFIFTVNKASDFQTGSIIFDSVNRKGKRLLDNDFIKNMLLTKIDSNDIESYHDKWLDMLSRLETTVLDVNQFLRYYMLAYHHRTSMKNVPISIKNMIDDGVLKPKDLIDKLYDNSGSYYMLYHPDEAFANNIPLIKNLKHLRILNSHSVYPALILSHDKFDNDAKFVQFEQIASMMLSYFFRARIIGRAEANSLENDIDNICKLLRKLDDPMEDIKYYIMNKSSYLSDDEFHDKFITSTHGSVVAKYILEAINNEIGNNTPNQTYHEYIMPRNPNANWIEYIKNQINYSDNDMIKQYMISNSKKIGNMTLLDVRNKDKNKDYGYKLSNVYANTSIQITQSLSKYPNWNFETIKKRTEEFANIAVKIWNIK